MHLPEYSSSIDEKELAKFEAIAEQWWDKQGKFKPLHMLNPTRLGYILEQVSHHFDTQTKNSPPLKGLKLLDIGCGGGLLSEPMAALGAIVVGADALEKNITVARIHAQQSKLQIDYRHTTAQALVAQGEHFDVILNMEVIEHVADPVSFVIACEALLKPGGLMICSTINRNIKSYITAIIGAERIMRWLPVGTHQFQKFITPEELTDMLEYAGLQGVDERGFIFNPFFWRWSTSRRDLSVNYVMTASKVIN